MAVEKEDQERNVYLDSHRDRGREDGTLEAVGRVADNYTMVERGMERAGQRRGGGQLVRPGAVPRGLVVTRNLVMIPHHASRHHHVAVAWNLAES